MNDERHARSATNEACTILRQRQDDRLGRFCMLEVGSEWLGGAVSRDEVMVTARSCTSAYCFAAWSTDCTAVALCTMRRGRTALQTEG